LKTIWPISVRKIPVSGRMETSPRLISEQVQKLLDQNSRMLQDKKTNPVKNLRKTIDLEDRTRTIPERVARQQEKIEGGIKNKTLTQEETKIFRII